MRKLLLSGAVGACGTARINAQVRVPQTERAYEKGNFSDATMYERG